MRLSIFSAGLWLLIIAAAPSTPRPTPTSEFVAAEGHTLIEVSHNGDLKFFNVDGELSVHLDTAGNLTFGPGVKPGRAAEDFADAVNFMRLNYSCGGAR